MYGEDPSESATSLALLFPLESGARGSSAASLEGRGEDVAEFKGGKAASLLVAGGALELRGAGERGPVFGLAAFAPAAGGLTPEVLRVVIERVTLGEKTA